MWSCLYKINSIQGHSISLRIWALAQWPFVGGLHFSKMGHPTGSRIIQLPSITFKLLLSLHPSDNFCKFQSQGAEERPGSIKFISCAPLHIQSLDQKAFIEHLLYIQHFAKHHGVAGIIIRIIVVVLMRPIADGTADWYHFI